MRARRLRLGRPPFIDSACNASGYDPIVADRWVVGNFSEFALTPTIPGLCLCKRRRESPRDAQFGSRWELHAVDFSKFPQPVPGPGSRAAAEPGEGQIVGRRAFYFLKTVRKPACSKWWSAVRASDSPRSFMIAKVSAKTVIAFASPTDKTRVAVPSPPADRAQLP